MSFKTASDIAQGHFCNILLIQWVTPLQYGMELHKSINTQNEESLGATLIAY